MNMQSFGRQDAFGKNPWRGPHAMITRRAFLGQGCSIPKGETAPATTPTGGGMMTPVAATSDTPWLVPALAMGGVAAVGAALWAFGVL